jgi:hypothetical protein
MCEALGSIPSTGRDKKKKKKGHYISWAEVALPLSPRYSEGYGGMITWVHKFETCLGRSPSQNNNNNNEE